MPCAGAEADEAGYPASTLRAFAMLGSGFAWVVLAPVIGFLGATLALGVAVIRFMGVTESVKVLAVPAITVALMWIVFDRMFGIALPQGPIEAFLQDLLPNIRIGG